MNIVEFINQYYIHLVTGYLVLIGIIVILVLLTKPFPSFKDSALYDIFIEQNFILSVTYSSVFVISLVLLIENVFDLRSIIKKNNVLELKAINSSRNVNLSKVVVVEEEKAMMEPSPGYVSTPPASSKSSSKSSSTKSMMMSREDCKSYHLYKQGEAKIIIANFLMIIAFLVPSSLILFSSRCI